MKKINLIIFASLLMTMLASAMEKEPIEREVNGEIETCQKYKVVVNTEEQKETSDELACWNNLPIEIKTHILSFILKSDDIEHAINEQHYGILHTIFKQLAILKLINQEIKEISCDRSILDLEKLIQFIISQPINTRSRIMMIISRWRLFDLCKRLILEGALEGISNAPLVYAICLHKIDTIKSLIQRDEKRAYLVDGSTELIMAAIAGNSNVLKLLLDARSSNIDSKNKSGNSALTVACQENNKKIIELLLDNNADIDAKDHDGNTPLMYAAMLGYQEIAKILLNRNANIDARNNDDHTALMIASLFGYEEIVKLLLEKGANIEIKNSTGDTAFMLASSAGYEVIVDLLNRADEIRMNYLVDQLFQVK